MNAKRALAAVTACTLSGLLYACGPGNTLPVQKSSVDFRLKAVESSLQKAQEELKTIEHRQTQHDAQVAEMQKKLGELLAVLQAHGVRPPAAAPQGSALGVGFARPGATGPSEAVLTDPGTASGQKLPGETPAPQAQVSPPSAESQNQSPQQGAVSQAPLPATNTAQALPAVSPQPSVITAPAAPGPAATREAKGRRGFGRVGPAEPPSPATPEAAIAADRATAQKAQTPAEEPAATVQAAAAPKPAATKPESPVAGNAETASPTEKTEYNQALQMAINGRTAEAKAAFDQFLAAHPQSPLTPNALYWIGEGALAASDYKAAISDFEKVAKGWPGHHKAADSLYKMAMAQEKSGDVAAARATLERYLKDYPNAELAGLARQKLQSLPK